MRTQTAVRGIDGCRCLPVFVLLFSALGVPGKSDLADRQCAIPVPEIVAYLEGALRDPRGDVRPDPGMSAVRARPTLESLAIVDARDSVAEAQIVAGWIRGFDGRVIGRRPSLWAWFPELERAYALNDVAREASELPDARTLPPGLEISENDSAMGEILTCFAL